MSPSEYSRMKQVSCMDIIDAIDGNRFENCSPDDILVVAATPLCTIDLSDTPEADKDTLYSGVYKFVSTVRNGSKLKLCKKEVIESALRTHWLPEVNDADKEKMLKSILLIEDFDEEGMPLFNEKRYEAYKSVKAKRAYSCAKYGNLDSWSRERKMAKSKRAPLLPIVKDANLHGNLKAFIDEYVEHWNYVVDLEGYKWRTVERWQKSFDFNSEDFNSMLIASLPGQHDNLLSGPMYYAKGVIMQNAKATQNKVKELLLNLFDENVDLDTRVKTYKAGFEKMNTENREKGLISSGCINTYQDDHAISVLLMLQNPSKHYLYKFSVYNGFVETTGVNYPKMRGGFVENLSRYEEVCEDIKEELMKNEKLIELHDKTYGNQFGYNLLVQDFIYAIYWHRRYWNKDK